MPIVRVFVEINNIFLVEVIIDIIYCFLLSFALDIRLSLISSDKLWILKESWSSIPDCFFRSS